MPPAALPDNIYPRSLNFSVLPFGFALGSSYRDLSRTQSIQKGAGVRGGPSSCFELELASLRACYVEQCHCFALHFLMLPPPGLPSLQLLLPEHFGGRDGAGMVAQTAIRCLFLLAVDIRNVTAFKSGIA